MQLWLDETTRTLALVAVNADPIPLTFSAEVDVAELLIDGHTSARANRSSRSVVARLRSGLEWPLQSGAWRSGVAPAMVENLTIPALSAIVVELRSASVR